MARAQVRYQYSALEIPVPGPTLLPQGILMWVASKPSPTALELSQSSSNESHAQSELRTCDRKQCSQVWGSSEGLFDVSFLSTPFCTHTIEVISIQKTYILTWVQ